MNYKLVSIFAVLFIGIVGIASAVYLYPGAPASFVVEVPVTPTACTEEAKVCPDGSSVGRTGPDCEFVACPVVPAPQPQGSGAALNERIVISDVSITPLAVISDSRCPVDVTCVWAGEVTLKTKLQKGGVSKEVVLKSNVPTAFEGMLGTLTSVTPENNFKKPFAKEEYRFAFKVTSSATVVSAKTGTVSGMVTTSPTCPVERIPPEPQCAPQPYATTVTIKEQGTTVVLKTVQSTASGTFTTSLPAGTYQLEARTINGAKFPRCEKAVVTVSAGKTTTADISCDTGIR